MLSTPIFAACAASPSIVSVASPGSTGIEIIGTASCDYLIRITDTFGSTDYGITTDGTGSATLPVFVQYSILIEVGQIESPFVATDSFTTAAAPPPPPVPVPSLGIWGALLTMLLVLTLAHRRFRSLG
jgi:hypothetical protein